LKDPFDGVLGIMARIVLFTISGHILDVRPRLVIKHLGIVIGDVICIH